MNVANWVVNLTNEDLPSKVVHQLKRCILDGLGAAIVGAPTAIARIPAEFCREMSADGPATVLATGDRLAVAPAVLANAVAANAWDIDDGYRLGQGHPGSFLITPAISACQDRGTKDLLAAIAAGYEVATRNAIGTQRTDKCYRGTGSWGSLGTAACMGKVIGLSEQQMRFAFGIAEYHAALSPADRVLANGAMTKDAIGWGAFAGACATYLAERGFTSHPSLVDAPENEDLFNDLGSRWRLMDLYFKPYACCRGAQPAIEGSLQIKTAHNLDWRDVKSLTVHTFRIATALKQSAPSNPIEAQYNLVWPIAAALVYGEVGPQQIGESALGDPDMLAMAERIQAVVEDDIEARFPAEALAWVEIETNGGKLLRSELLCARGDAHCPLSDEEIEAKFVWLTQPIIGDESKTIIDLVAGVDRGDGEEALVQAVGNLCIRR